MAIFNSYVTNYQRVFGHQQIQVLVVSWLPSAPVPEATLNVLAKARRWEEVRVFREGHGEDMILMWTYYDLLWIYQQQIGMYTLLVKYVSSGKLR